MTQLVVQTETESLIVNLPSPSVMNPGQFYEFCQANQELRIERTAKGEVIIMSPAFSDTGSCNFKIAVQLGIWVEQDGTGIGFDSSAGFTLPNGAVKSPDAAWIKRERWNSLSEEQKASFAPICPDFVIELRSSSDSLTGLQAKMQEYLDNGVSLGWLIDRQNRQIHIYRPQHPPEILDQPETVNGGSVLPGFVLNLTQIWGGS